MDMQCSHTGPEKARPILRSVGGKVLVFQVKQSGGKLGGCRWARGKWYLLTNFHCELLLTVEFVWSAAILPFLEGSRSLPCLRLAALHNLLHQYFFSYTVFKVLIKHLQHKLKSKHIQVLLQKNTVA